MASRSERKISFLGNFPPRQCGIATFTRDIRQAVAEQRRVMEELIQQSDALVVMTERGQRILREVYAAPQEKLEVIPHDIPDLPFVNPNFYKVQFGVAGRLDPVPLPALLERLRHDAPRHLHR